MHAFHVTDTLIITRTRCGMGRKMRVCRKVVRFRRAVCMQGLGGEREQAKFAFLALRFFFRQGEGPSAARRHCSLGCNAIAGL
jgi:hypothetical protein